VAGWAVVLLATGIAVGDQPASSAPPSNTIAVGRVLSASGGAPVANAQVSVWWVPGQATAQPGQTLSVETLGTATTAPDGSYALSITPSADLIHEALTNGGWVNLDLGASTPDQGAAGAVVISRQLSAGSWAASSLRKLSARKYLATHRVASATGSEAPYQPDSRSYLTDLKVTPDAAPRAGGVGDRQLRRQAYCSLVTDAKPLHQVSLFELHNASNSDLTWDFGKTSDSDIESGIQYGGTGGWQIGGTYHVSNTMSADAGQTYKTAKNTFARSTFQFIEAHYQAYGTGQYCEGTSIPPNTKVTFPALWAGGATNESLPGSEFVGCSNPPQSNYKTPFGPGAHFTRNSSSAARIGLSIDLGPITVGSTTGFSTSASEHWDGTRGGFWLCGTYAPPSTAGVIHAQNR
jgi:hypothetical protein